MPREKRRLKRWRKQLKSNPPLGIAMEVWSIFSRLTTWRRYSSSSDRGYTDEFIVVICRFLISRLGAMFAFEPVTLKPISKVLPDIQMMNQQAIDLWFGKTKSDCKTPSFQQVTRLHLMSSNEIRILVLPSLRVYHWKCQVQKGDRSEPYSYQEGCLDFPNLSVLGKSSGGSLKGSRGIFVFRRQ